MGHQRVPVYLLIAIWGGKQRQYAATKFILYTATASLLILISGLALALSGDTFTLNLSELAARSPGGTFGLLCYLGLPGGLRREAADVPAAHLVTRCPR